MATAILPLINGRSYSYADITVIILGAPIIGVTSIEYGEDAMTENIYATGRFPVSRGTGQVTPTAKITLLMEEVLNLMTAVTSGRLYDIPEFDIIVSFTDTSLIPVVHKIRNCKFKTQTISSSTGDTSIPVEMELVISHIEWQ